MSHFDEKREKTRKLVDRSRELGLMHAKMVASSDEVFRHGELDLISFKNCSYLGFDTHPQVVAGAQKILGEWGVHYCCARSRLSIGPLAELEKRLTRLFGTSSITFPSVTSAHAAVVPLVASGLLREDSERPVRFVFDRFAHASMQVLKPNIRRDGDIVTIEHNDMDALRREAEAARRRGEDCVYFCDSVYSMGGVCPLGELLSLQQAYGLYLYIDDAHGTSIFGEKGEGFVASGISGMWPARLFATFSLAKGFGSNGGGILLPSERAEDTVRYDGQTYGFSGPLDFAIVGAALEVLRFHESGEVKCLQQELRRKVRLVDQAMGLAEGVPFSPIRMVSVGSEELAVDIASSLRSQGFYVPAVFYPVVPWEAAQLRICIILRHDDADLLRLCAALTRFGLSVDDPRDGDRNDRVEPRA